ncbi:MAG TPA: helix-turn-helix domain-containing protein [Solirubrobacterales bacterium]
MSPPSESKAAPSRPRAREIDRSLLKVMGHPVKVRALSVLSDRSASPKEIADQLDLPIGQVSYHVRALEELGMIELVGTRQVRGAVEHFYKAVSRLYWDDEEWAELSLEEREQVSLWIKQQEMVDVALAFDAGTFDRRLDRHLSRVPLVLDEEGWKELSDLMAAGLEAIFEIQARSSERIAREGGGGGFPAAASMSCFEMPEQKEPSRE